MNIWLVGGEKVIPTSVETAIKGDGYTVTRINGSDRYETAALIAEAGTKLSGKKPSKVFVASGTSFADALAVSPVAFVKGYPIILTEKDSTSDFSKKELGNIGTDSKVLVGGTAVVSDKVAADLSIKSDARVAGADRAVTANLISDWAKKSEGFNTANAALVGGTNGNGADSLVAASLLGKSYTTLHFAGWDATSVYLKDHSSELTGKGFVFGGKAAVTGDQVSAAQSAAQTAAVAAGFVVTSYAAGSTSFGYADPVAKKAVTVKFATSDKFSIDGTPATAGAFAAALAKGDVVAITAPGTAGGATTFALTNKTAADYGSGMVGGLNITGSTVGGLAANSISIAEPVTGVSLNAFAYAGTYTVFTVDGASVSQAIFESSLSIGDSVAVTGTGADANHVRTIALKNASVSGTITDITSNAITIKTAAGASLGTVIPAASGDTFIVDGAASTKTAFQATATGATVGDQLTYSQSGGIQTFTLVNSAPTSASGIVAGTSSSSQLAFWAGPQTAGVVPSYSALATANATYSVDGSVASQAEFIAAATPGDVITYQAADTATNTKASLSLVSKPLSGTVTAADNSGHTLSVANGDNNALVTTKSYTTANSVYAAGTSVVYTVDGVTKTQAQFDVAVGNITSGALTGTVQASVSGSVVTWALATSAFTAAPTMVSGTNAHTTAVAVTLNKPASGTLSATGDLTVAVNGTPVTLGSAPTVSGSTLSITLPTATSANDVITVTPTATGAAKVVDVYGSALAITTLSITSS